MKLCNYGFSARNPGADILKKLNKEKLIYLKFKLELIFIKLNIENKLLISRAKNCIRAFASA